VLRLEIEREEVPGEGWVVHAPEVLATAQGPSVEEARANLLALLEAYPEVLQPLVDAASRQPPKLELVAV